MGENMRSFFLLFGNLRFFTPLRLLVFYKNQFSLFISFLSYQWFVKTVIIVFVKIIYIYIYIYLFILNVFRRMLRPVQTMVHRFDQQHPSFQSHKFKLFIFECQGEILLKALHFILNLIVVQLTPAMVYLFRFLVEFLLIVVPVVLPNVIFCSKMTN